MVALGIDVGHKQTMIAVEDANRIQMFSIDGLEQIPSCLGASEKGVVMGLIPITNSSTAPDLVCRLSLKSLDSKEKFKVGNKRLKMTEALTLFLKQLRERLEEDFGTEGKAAVFTIPNYLNDTLRGLFKASAEAAGFTVRRLVPAPTAAMYSYLSERRLSGCFLVVDLGAGGFDVAVMNLNQSDVEVKAISGGPFCGGDHMDARIAQALLGDGAVNSANTNQRGGVGASEGWALAERVKIDLATQTGVTISAADHPGINGQVSMDRVRLESILRPQLEEIHSLAEQAVVEAGLNVSDLNGVVLTGGMRNHPTVIDFFSDHFDRVISPQQDHGAARGAALINASLKPAQVFTLGGSQAQTTSWALAGGARIQDVIPHSLGIDCKTNKGFLFKKNRFVPILVKNTPYPHKQAVLGFSETLWTEQIRLNVFRGEETIPKKNDWIGRLVFKVSRKYLGETRVGLACIFELDENAILHFTAVEMPFQDHAAGPLELLEKEAAGNDMSVPVSRIEELLREFKFKFKKISLKAV